MRLQQIKEGDVFKSINNPKQHYITVFDGQDNILFDGRECYRHNIEAKLSSTKYVFNIDCKFSELFSELNSVLKSYIISYIKAHYKLENIPTLLDNLSKMKPHQRLFVMNFYQTEQGYAFWESVYNRMRVSYES